MKNSGTVFGDANFDPIEYLIKVANGDVVGLGFMTQSELNHKGTKNKDGTWKRKPGKMKAAELLPIRDRIAATKELLPYAHSKKAPMAIIEDGEDEYEAVQIVLPDNGRERNAG